LIHTPLQLALVVQEAPAHRGALKATILYLAQLQAQAVAVAVAGMVQKVQADQEVQAAAAAVLMPRNRAAQAIHPQHLRLKVTMVEKTVAVAVVN
jgi:hypothetical protein